MSIRLPASTARLFTAATVLLAIAIFPRNAAGQAGTVAGINEPFRDILLSAPVAGTLAKRLVREGDSIKEGQALIELEKKQEELEVERRKLVFDSKAELKAAQARAATLKTDLESTRKLFESSRSVSKDDMAKKELEYQLALAEVERTEQTEAREEVEYHIAQEILSQKVLKSPLTGLVVELFRDAGEECKPQEPLVRLVDTHQFYFVANVEARAGYGMKVGDSVTVEVEAGTAKIPITGKVSFVSPVVDPASGLLKVKVLCDNIDGKVKPGVAGSMRLAP
jgi:RND family efflux transporter MFP subunit